ncbi:MAG: NAD(P)H-hydrate dehydratase [Candidatus Heimdallarchaeota archaeon]|nr:NAD(P)H-hydrate dehydratase [Candidatus Heimdallarchaeota archaeon]
MFTLKDLPIPHPTYLSREEILAIEQNEFDTGVTPLDLMQNAGVAIANTCKVICKDDLEILILAGSGNNGGDASVAAKLLVEHFDITFIYLKRPKTKEAKVAHDELIQTNVVIHYLSETISLEQTLHKVQESKVIIDAVFGTGLKNHVRTPTDVILNLLGKLPDAKIISIDLPSGMDCNTGKWYCEKFIPQTIISMHFSKRCFKIIEKEEYGSNIVISDIGIKPTSFFYVSANYLKQYWPIRDPDSHKGQNGRVMVIGGSDDFTGAPVLSGMATMRSGIDTLRIAVPESIRDIVASYAEDFIAVKVDGTRITSKGFKRYRNMAVQRHDVIAMGMGLSNHPDCTKFAREFYQYAKEKVKFVIDAEAIRAFRGHLNLLHNSKAILTPHKRELRMMLDEDLPGEFIHLIEFAQNKAKELGVTLLIKGKIDIITNGYRTILNTTGHAGMTVGGSGDVLAGVVAASYAFIDDPFIAAAVAAFVMGKAGEMAAEKFGYGLMASDIVKELPGAFMRFDVNK